MVCSVVKKGDLLDGGILTESTVSGICRPAQLRTETAHVPLHFSKCIYCSADGRSNSGEYLAMQCTFQLSRSVVFNLCTRIPVGTRRHLHQSKRNTGTS
jgi:hypothetical protein